jgi:hypothetical protein
VAGVLADKCINPDTQRPYTLSMVERALRDVHFSVDPKRGAKQQALQARRALSVGPACRRLLLRGCCRPRCRGAHAMPGRPARVGRGPALLMLVWPGCV